MRIEFNNNVYLVDGKVYDCIYDLNTLQLYRVNKKTSELLTECCKNNIQLSTTPESKEEKLLQFLIKEGILCTEEAQKCEPIVLTEKVKIKTVWLEITQLCNFKCIHCYEGDKARVSMCYSDIKSIIDMLKSNEVENLHIIGGEPLLHPQIEMLLDYCVGKFDSFSIYTNASAISHSICTLLKKLNATVYVSLNSDIAEEFDRVTGTHNLFTKVLKGIEMLHQYELDVVVKKVSLAGVAVSRQYETFFGSFGGFPVLVGNASLQQYSDEMLLKKIITEDSFQEKLDADSVLINMKENYCFRDRIYIDVFGDVYPCAMERRVKHGNIFRISFEKITSSPLRKATKDHVQECRECEYRYACNTCYVDTLSEDFHAKPWFCSYQPQIGAWMPYDEFVQLLKERFPS